MLILTSPAKRLDETSVIPAFVRASKPQFLKKTASLHSLLASLSADQLQDVLHVSEDLAKLNFDRFQTWSELHTQHNSRPALYTFKGDVFQQLQIEEYTKDQIGYLGRSLRILSGYYGVLRALDHMQPYRLEMGLAVPEVGSLQNYWKEHVTTSLNAEIEQQGHQCVLNLASQEYSAAVDLAALACPVLSINFKQVRNGQLKTFGMLAKRARGMMIDFCAMHNVETVDQLQNFDRGGYELKDVLESGLVFVQKAE